MKKYISALFAFTLFITLLGFNANSASADVSGCMPGDIFSRTTGQRCVQPACSPGDIFSSTTGERCDASTSVYPPGCTSNTGYSTTTGLPCNIPSVTCPVSQICNPNISSVTNPISVGRKMSIQGVSLNRANDFGLVYIDNVLVRALVDGSKDGTVLFFVLPNLSIGKHDLYVTNGSAVTSNVVTFEVKQATCLGFDSITGKPCGDNTYKPLPIDPNISGKAELVSANENVTRKSFGLSDWKWKAAITNGGTNPKSIKRMILVHNSSGEGWATDDSGNNPTGKGLYQLGTNLPNNCQANCDLYYTSNLGVAIDAGQTRSLYAYGDPGSWQFSGGYLLIEFADNTSAKISIPASNITPTTVTSNKPSIISLGTDNALPGEKVAMYISNFPNAQSYTVTFSGQSMSGDTDGNLSSDGTYLAFTVPNFPAGSYKLTAQGRNYGGALAFNTQNSIAFTIGTPAVETKPSIALISKNITVIPLETTDQPTQATGVFKFKIYSLSSDMYISRKNPQELVQGIFNNSVVVNPIAVGFTALENSSGDTSDYYKVDEGVTRTFDISFVVGPTQGSGFYKAEATSLRFKNGDPIKFGNDFVTTNVMLTGVAVKSSSVAASLIGTYYDKAGTWGVFGPGPGNTSLRGYTSEDWNLKMKLTLGSEKTISSIALDHYVAGRGIIAGERWYTNNSSLYPLVVYKGEDNQINNGYDFKWPAYSAGTYDLDLFAQKESKSFLGGRLVVYFTDGTSVTATVPILPTIIVSEPNGVNVKSSERINLKWTQNYVSSDLIVKLYGLRDPYYEGHTTGRVGSNSFLLPIEASNSPVSEEYRFEICDENVKDASQGGRYLCAYTPGTFKIIQPAPVAFTSSTLTGSAINSVLPNQALSQNSISKKSLKFTKFLEEGSYGNEVRELQKFLNGAGYDAGKVDGVFGPGVKIALMKFQTDNGLKADGILGFEVRNFLNK